MTFAKPEAGLVIRYVYLWRREAEAGSDEGRKDRPCGVVLAHADAGGRTRAYVLPITHTNPAAGVLAIEIPSVVNARLGLDADRSWIVLTEANLFVWPGPDLRPVPGKEPGDPSYGFLPPRFFRNFRTNFLDAHAKGKVTIVVRTE